MRNTHTNTHTILKLHCTFISLSHTDAVDIQYRQNEVTPVDYLEFKHHSYSDMVAVSNPVHGPLDVCWVSEC